ncbi:Myb-like DNA-binding domain containing protein [Tritrichomonas foetus]|uniref:Myb-like DNA-binding domain containing protein n=1 Tax=Tritrichomonas foetus TaxID=1144522 RepID=A0A1J4KWP2_9EUKA|nr:Myb-like DNA-binding domain containing protein [Tritrichomonas foetus]|eukprot:OHT13957.1 Myb-like DNA-binding domain containing protein [Tritrichomonas foetus]
MMSMISFGKVKCPKKKFTPEEDAMLLKLVKQIGACKWDTIALSMPGRKGRQCRDRYMNYLNPNVNHDEWTAEEDALLSKKVSEYGTRWSKISKFFDGRTGPALKNRWNYRLSHKQNDSNSQNSNSQNDSYMSSPNESHGFLQDDSSDYSSIDYNDGVSYDVPTETPIIPFYSNVVQNSAKSITKEDENRTDSSGDMSDADLVDNVFDEIFRDLSNEEEFVQILTQEMSPNFYKYNVMSIW